MAVNDTSIPAALIFIDALGDTLPFKRQFTYKELNDFVHREGVAGLAGHEVAEPDLMKIGYIIEGVTNGHIRVVAGPTESGSRSPLSKIDLRVAKASRNKECHRCGVTIKTGGLCQPCRDDIDPEPVEAETRQAPMQIYASATLRDGTTVQIVEAGKEKYIGLDDDFVAHEFDMNEVAHYANLDMPLQKLGDCTLCGSPVVATACDNCETEQ